MGYNILESCTYYNIDINKIENKEFLKVISEDLGLDKENPYIMLDGMTIYDYQQKCGYDCFRDSISYDESIEFDDTELESTLTTYLGNYPYYLVLASGCRWNGESGYKICSNICETVYRDYDITLELIGELSGRDGIICRESSHDVPMGSETIIMGITDEEYDQIDEMEFNEVENFISKYKS